MNGVVPFTQAKLRDESYVYDARPISDEFGWITDTDYFEDIDDPVTVTRQRWRLVAEDKVVFHPRTELCANCDGDGAVNTPLGVAIDCPTCGGDGGHPLAGTMEVLS